MSVINLVPKSDKPHPEVEDVLSWLDRTKECVLEYGVTNIAIAWVDEKGGTGSGHICFQPAALLGSIEIMKKELFDNTVE